MQEVAQLVARDFRHAAREVSRVGNLWNIAQEVPAAVTMFLDSLLMDAHAPASAHDTNPHVIFMPGFFARFGYYLRLGAYLHENGVELIIPKGLRRNTLTWQESHTILSNAIMADEDATGVVPILMGHSKGGADILGTLPGHPEIELAIFASSPLRGASLHALNLYLSIRSGEYRLPFDPDALTDPTLLAKIVVAVSDYDKIVPAHEAELEGARDTIRVEKRPGLDVWHSHTGLPYRVRKEVLATICENQVRIHAS
ncbi:MAG: hypothetical protein EXS68_02645 [Candidatus Ryanbacteria bacterium]|nr:hypothetical protein [Candidatus Ryanbacteria bacterium]